MLRKTLFVLFALTAPASLLIAQDDPTRGSAARAAAQQLTTINVDFPGGTLQDLVDAMRRTDPSLNITASLLAKQVQMPALSVKGASVLNVLNAAAAIAPSEYGVACSAGSGPGEPVYTVMVQTRANVATTMGGQPPQREVRVFSLRLLTEPQWSDDKQHPIALSADTVLSAIEAGVQMGSQKQATLKYHRDSGLLFVDGTPGQLSVAREVLQNLMNDQQELRRQQMLERAQRPGPGAPHKADK